MNLVGVSFDHSLSSLIEPAAHLLLALGLIAIGTEVGPARRPRWLLYWGCALAGAGALVEFVVATGLR